jgi:hypothetical protein
MILPLGSTSFTATIPTEIGNARFLSYMYLYDNGLVGEIPTEMGQLTLLKEFWISGNALEGRIPSELGLIRDVGKNGGSASFRYRDKPIATVRLILLLLTCRNL